MRIEFKRNTEKKKGEFSKKVVKFVIAINTIFAALVFYAFIKTGNEPSTLITAWFAFTTVELWELGKIKRNKKEKENNGNESDL